MLGGALMPGSPLQVYVWGTPVADLLMAIGDPGKSERPESCDVFEGALLRLIQQPSLAEPAQEPPPPPRLTELPHAGTCQLPKVPQLTMLLNSCIMAAIDPGSAVAMLSLPVHILGFLGSCSLTLS